MDDFLENTFFKKIYHSVDFWGFNRNPYSVLHKNKNIYQYDDTTCVRKVSVYITKVIVT